MGDDWQLLVALLALGTIVLGMAGYALWNWGAVKWRERSKTAEAEAEVARDERDETVRRIDVFRRTRGKLAASIRKRVQESDPDR